MNPLVTVLMPVYNGEKYLREAIDSILNQTFTDFEFLIINDGSTDNTEEIILSYDDTRINYVKNEKNLQLIATLNKGLELANGKYIARMDSDDVSMLERLEKQFQYMEKNKNIGVLGTWVNTNNNLIFKYPVSTEECEVFSFFNSPVAHPSVMIRNEIINKYNISYSFNYEICEDMELWRRMSEYSGVANIGEILLSYRIHPDSHSNKNKEKQKFGLKKYYEYELSKMGININEIDLDLHMALVRNEISHKIKNRYTLDDFGNWLSKLLNQNKQKKIFDQKIFFDLLQKRYYNAVKTYISDPLSIFNYLKNKKVNDPTLFAIGKSYLSAIKYKISNIFV